MIFEYESEHEVDEVLFGFGLHANEDQPVFASSEEMVVKEFRSLYTQLYNFANTAGGTQSPGYPTTKPAAGSRDYPLTASA